TGRSGTCPTRMTANRRFAILVSLGILGVTLSAQTPGRGGQGGGAPAAPGRGSASGRWEPWSAMRTGCAGVVGGQVGGAAEPLGELSFFSAVERTDLLGLGNFEGTSSQKVNLEIPKFLTYKLAPGEVNAVKDRLNVMSVRMTAYRVPTIGPGEEESR